jgi:hypothetical protein
VINLPHTHLLGVLVLAAWTMPVIAIVIIAERLWRRHMPATFRRC